MRILITAVGAPGAPGIIRCLRGPFKDTLIGTDVFGDAVGFSMVDQHYVVPPGDSPEFIPRMKEIVREESIDVILPLSTRELIPLASNRKVMGTLCTVCVSNTTSLRLANNKARLMEHLSHTDIPIAEWRTADSLESLIAATEALGYPQKPVCFKPQEANGSRGFRILDETNDDRFDILFNEKPHNVRSTIQEISSILIGRDDIPPLIVMEYLPGDEYSVDVLCKDGESIVAIPRRRDKITQGICTKGVTLHDQRLIDVSKRIVSSLGLSYCINLQFKKDKEGNPRLLEINPRVSGTIVHCAAAGVNLPKLAVQMAMGRDIEEVEPDWNICMTRHWQEVFYKEDGSSFTYA